MACLIDPERTSASVTSVAKLDIPLAVSPYGQGNTPENVLSNLKSNADLIHGVARFSNLTFGVPGADAQMHGTYNVINHRIDLHGNMRVATRISKTSTGMKSFALKVLDPLFRKKKKGEVVPVHVEGTYEKPEFGLDITKPGDKNSPAKLER